ncbi:MAG: asparagine--tRNA ligase, partial [Gammaproteobacteria bacterium]|nr:asparagine--tRNA ligase [Gammaproteobacteria bacterium]
MPPSRPTSIRSMLEGPLAEGPEVSVAGWLKSRRTSRGGFSFLALNDGSCFADLQVVADESLPNYASIVELGAGCAVSVRGKLVGSQGRGQDR